MSRLPAHSDDELEFIDETLAPEHRAPAAGKAWRVMIVDDDTDVHSATTFALRNLEMQQRPLEFLHAHSAAQARDLLAQHDDIAVILLDVVMEQEDSGLELVRHIRETLKLGETRIILHTGQPGYAPELEAIRDFDINDYRTKSELTRVKLYTAVAVAAAIRSYDQIRAINANRRGLDRIVRASTELMALHGLDNFAAGVLEEAAGLLGLVPNGVLCMQEREGGTDGKLNVVAAAGRRAGMRNAAASGVDDARVAAALAGSLAQRGNVYGEDFIALYLGGGANRDFAAFIDTEMPLDETGRRLLEVFCRHIAVGLDNVLLVSNLHNSAFYDPLTRLPNRTRLKELVDEALASGADATLALVDIDHFAETNDALGHQFGDMLLLGVAARLQSHLGCELAIGRVAGDTFGVLGPAALVEPGRLLALFNTPFSIDDQQVQLSATVGLVRLAEHAGSGADALKDADIALKRAKQLQRSGHFYFSRSMGVDIRERVRMMHALRNAVKEQELFVVYQPQIDLATRRPVGAEALLRWKTADGNFIPPDRFIPIAEFSGLIIDIGERVLRDSCRELLRLHGLGFEDFTISVNVSQVQFRHPRFLDMLRGVLAETQAPPSRIELEITESIAMEEPDVLIRLLGQIKQTGVNIAIDDFGTGFSSLSYLQRLQADRLKIDRSFVTEITGSARGSSIAEMVIQLGRNLGLSVVAEGVEDERQASILEALGCPLAQGYLFARPMTPDQLTIWLKDHDAG